VLSRLNTTAMHPLWLSNFVVLLICVTSVAMQLNSVAHDGGATEYTSDCSKVPYPFGVRGDALKGFEVTCPSITAENRTAYYMPSMNSTHYNKSNPYLLLPTGRYPIQDISLQGQVSILTEPICQQHYDNGSKVQSYGNGWLNLTGTPFTLSKNSTTLVAIGCDVVVMIESVSGNGNRSKSGCVAICTNSISIIDGSCFGLGCCQMQLPGPVKSFKLNLSKIDDMGVNGLNNRSAAFFTKRDGFSFHTTSFRHDEYFRAMEAPYVTVLDWAIGDNTCEEAKKYVTSFACKNNSQCIDSPSGVGYFCNCSKGYEGNPYEKRGCTGKCMPSSAIQNQLLFAMMIKIIYHFCILNLVFWSMSRNI
jgi:hypothetical protein